MNYGCKNKVIIITGGTSGIGKTCAEFFVADGAKVFVLARYKKTVKGCEFVQCDVTKRANVKKALIHIAKVTGKIDVVVNCAGIYVEQRLEQLTDKLYAQVMNTNVLGTMLVCQYALQYMQKGCIVNVASDAATTGNYGCALYSASKGAVVAFTKSLAKDVAPNIRVICVAPADVDTPLMQKQCKIGHYTKEECASVYPLGRIAKPQEIAHVICSMASPANGFMTGAVIAVDGGI